MLRHLDQASYREDLPAANTELARTSPQYFQVGARVAAHQLDTSVLVGILTFIILSLWNLLNVLQCSPSRSAVSALLATIPYPPAAPATASHGQSLRGGAGGLGLARSNNLFISPSLFQFGLDNQSIEFIFAMRTALPENLDKFNQYLDDLRKEVRIFRLRARGVSGDMGGDSGGGGSVHTGFPG